VRGSLGKLKSQGPPDLKNTRDKKIEPVHC
jgi:hypothetical protein